MNFTVIYLIQTTAEWFLQSWFIWSLYVWSLINELFSFAVVADSNINKILVASLLCLLQMKMLQMKILALNCRFCYLIGFIISLLLQLSPRLWGSSRQATPFSRVELPTASWLNYNNTSVVQDTVSEDIFPLHVQFLHGSFGPKPLKQFLDTVVCSTLQHYSSFGLPKWLGATFCEVGILATLTLSQMHGFDPFLVVLETLLWSKQN